MNPYQGQKYFTMASAKLHYQVEEGVSPVPLTSRILVIIAEDELWIVGDCVSV